MTRGRGRAILTSRVGRCSLQYSPRSSFDEAQGDKDRQGTNTPVVVPPYRCTPSRAPLCSWTPGKALCTNNQDRSSHPMCFRVSRPAAVGPGSAYGVPESVDGSYSLT